MGAYVKVPRVGGDYASLSRYGLGALVSWFRVWGFIRLQPEFVYPPCNELTRQNAMNKVADGKRVGFTVQRGFHVKSRMGLRAFCCGKQICMTESTDAKGQNGCEDEKGAYNSPRILGNL